MGSGADLDLLQEVVLLFLRADLLGPQGKVLSHEIAQREEFQQVATQRPLPSPRFLRRTSPVQAGADLRRCLPRFVQRHEIKVGAPLGVRVEEDPVSIWVERWMGMGSLAAWTVSARKKDLLARAKVDAENFAIKGVRCRKGTSLRPRDVPVGIP